MVLVLYAKTNFAFTVRQVALKNGRGASISPLDIPPLANVNAISLRPSGRQKHLRNRNESGSTIYAVILY